MLLIFNGSYASSDGHPSTAAGMPSASNHFRYSDYPVVIVEKLPSEFRFEHLGSLHLLVVCFIGHGLAAVSRWFRHWWLGRVLHTPRASRIRLCRASYVELRIAVQDADDFMLDHLQRLSERLAHGLL